MPKMQKTYRICDCVGERDDGLTATNSQRQNNCYMHGMFSEGKVANGLVCQKNENGKFYSDLIGWMYPFLKNVRLLAS